MKGDSLSLINPSLLRLASVCGLQYINRIDLMGDGGSRSHYLPQPSFPQQYPPEPSIVQEERAFLNCFEQQYGGSHPFFYACRFTEALEMAQAAKHKFVFLYLHSPEHPFTPKFCRETLCSEPVVQFLGTNFICWAALANSREGSKMEATLMPASASYPFCAVVARASGDDFEVLEQIQCPVSPAQLVEILQRTLDEKGLAFGRGRAREEERTRVDRRLRQEQDAAYLSARPAGRKEDAGSEELMKIKIKIQLPNDEWIVQSFKSTDKIQAIYGRIEFLQMRTFENYKLKSGETVYDQRDMTLTKAGLYDGARLSLVQM